MSFPPSVELAGCPPPNPMPAPLRTELPAGTRLWRIHSDHFAPDAFNPTPRRSPADGGGRFDSDDGAYAWLYAAQDTVGATAEALLRTPHPPRPYLLPRALVAGTKLSRIELRRTVQLAQLHGPGLSALGVDSRLTSCGPGLLYSNYAVTRRWSACLFDQHPQVAGLVWRARHDNDRLVYVFFEPRCPPGTFEAVPDASFPIDEPGLGYALVRAAALKHGASLALG
jgi:hypothetical protein